MNKDEKIKVYKFIIDGIKICIKTEQLALLKIIMLNSPDIKFTVNNNGVFLPLTQLNEHTLLLCESKIRYAIEQSRREQERKIVQKNLAAKFNS